MKEPLDNSPPTDINYKVASMIELSLPSVVVFLVTLLLVWLLTTVVGRRRGVPGPFPYPVVGNLPILRAAGPDTLATLARLAQDYGCMYQLNLGQMRAVFINDATTLHEAFVKQASDFIQRPYKPPVLQMIKKEVGLGVLLSNGLGWKEMRKIAVTTMREMGVGKRSLEEKVMEEVTVVLNELSAVEGTPCYIKPVFSKATSNVVCNVTFGTRFEHDDAKFLKLLGYIEATFRVNALFQPVNFFPVLQYIPFMMKPARRFAMVFKEEDAHIQELLQDHEATFDPDNIRDFVDMVIDLRAKNKGDQHFTEQNMRRAIGDLFTAGSDTTAAALTWMMTFMAAYPAVQGRVQAEVDKVIGKSRQVTLADKSNLPYTEATVFEALRMGMIAPLGIPHVTTKDTPLRGRIIPKDTLIIPNIHVMTQDPDVFPEPLQFKPSRWLDDQGVVTGRDRLPIFSKGPRSCAGEILAKMELNLFFPTIMQFYSVRSAAADGKVDTKGFLGTTFQAPTQDLIYEKR